MLLLAAAVFAGSAACRPCHSAIYEAWRQTPMARSSGRAVSLPPAEFTAGGHRFRIANDRLSFTNGSASIDYFVGSGVEGRTYLTFRDGFLFELPVTWYARQQLWDASPGFEHEPEVKLDRAIDPSCLWCHASGLQPIHGTVNKYADVPFLEDGVGCERCHGPGSEHIRNPQSAHLVNPATLPAPERDSVCAQCHLTGEARIDRAGRQFAEYRAGDNLADLVTYFVWSPRPAGIKVTSHVEKLAMSACKRASGDALWCGTCHDPHTNANRAQSACLGCHPSAHRQSDSCLECHMPHARTTDVAHGVMTDHGIPRDPHRAIAPAKKGVAELRAFAGIADDRSLGLAYAETGDSRARQYLLKAVPADAPVLVRLALLEQDPGRAALLYARALRAEPFNSVALVNLGVLRAREGRLGEAAQLWRRALETNPAIEPSALDLAKISPPEEARVILRRYLAFNPDSSAARVQLSSIQ